ncbi:2TM domain-containing protein [uncultured Winogradskyella sp.]|uniref:2TM domain-containing protein n=1 Tax=uncultured Winogradskyella sp. TaxID=395353 RepID=UPI00260C24CA|nr:2TM domain-containing protein [uncultured Winogradskyella sp.]
MTLNKDEKQLLVNAQNKVRRIKIFYLHLVFYIIGIALILYNFYIIEDGPYKNNIISLNLSIIVGWSVFIIIHGLNTFKEKAIFKRSWEERKIKEFTKEEDSEKKLWE